MIHPHGVLEISASRFQHNLDLLRTAIGDKTMLCATIKANAYGHGVAPIAGLLKSAAVDWAAVYSLEEAFALAASKFKTLALCPVVLTAQEGFISRKTLQEILACGIRLNLTDAYSTMQLSLLADQFLGGAKLPIHMQVDTGLTRVGVSADEAVALAERIADFPGLRLEGIFSHFSHGDVPGDPTVAAQLEILLAVAQRLKEKRPKLIVHMQNSGGAFHLPAQGLDMVRIGIALYGLQPSMQWPIEGLLPIARLRAPILAIHDRPAGTGVGYGHTFRTTRPSRLAVVPVGYADGIPRLLSNRCIAQIREREVPIVGRISMDQIILDITDLGALNVGEMATVISWDPAHANCLDRLAEACGTIGYELATHLGSRLERVVVA